MVTRTESGPSVSTGTGLPVESMEYPGQPVVSPAAGMKNNARGHTEGQAAGINHFQAVGIEIKKDITSLGIGPMDQGIDQQLPDNLFVKGWDCSPAVRETVIRAISLMIRFAHFSQPAVMGRDTRPKRTMLLESQTMVPTSLLHDAADCGIMNMADGRE